VSFLCLLRELVVLSLCLLIPRRKEKVTGREKINQKANCKRAALIFSFDFALGAFGLF
jgi:hypothetical protein